MKPFRCVVLVVLGSLSLAATAGADDVPQQKATAFSWVDEHRDALWKLNRFIWERAELGLEEHESSSALAEMLEEQGFTVTRGISHMPTAFMASYGEGRPVVAILAEFDALPGMSQKPEPTKVPQEPGGNGHACGHSVFGVASSGGAMAARSAMEHHGLRGTLRVYGTPAEETGIGKSYMARDGVFDDCDIVLHWHPGDTTKVSFSSCKAVVSVKYTFSGRAAHASRSPHDGRSALDAVELMNIAANYLREHLKEDARMHYVITDGGGQPNVVPPKAQVWYYLRANDHLDVETMFDRMAKIAEGAALMTETEVEIDVDADSFELLPNLPISQVIQRNLELVGPPQFSDDERTFARKTQEPLVALRGRAIEKALDDSVAPLTGEPSFIPASTDVGNVSWRVPTSGFRAACYTYGAPGHSWQIVSCTGMSIGEKGLNCAARVLAATSIDYFLDPSLIDAARKDFEKRRGDRKIRSLIPKDQKPPVKIR